MSSWVDFKNISDIVAQYPTVHASRVCTQATFLEGFGIDIRVEQLVKGGGDREQLEGEKHRLMAKEEMGENYKVMAIGSLEEPLFHLSAP